jgi:hypothetical protein
MHRSPRTRPGPAGARVTAGPDRDGAGRVTAPADRTFVRSEADQRPTTMPAASDVTKPNALAVGSSTKAWL